jgi:hypothetical protein
MTALAAALCGAGLTALTSAALGSLLLRRCGIKLYRDEERLLSFVCGAAALSFLVFCLCAVRLASPWSFGLLSVAAAAAAWRWGKLRRHGDRFTPLPRLWRCLFAAVFLAYLYVYLPIALAPEVSPDGSTYHLGLVARYLREGGFVPIRDNMYAQLSQGVELLYLFSFAFGGHPAAATTHLCFLIALPLAMLSYARRFGFDKAGACGALLVFLSPVVGIDGASAYVDVAVACVVFAVFYLLQIWRQAGSPDNGRWFFITGLTAGFCFAAKYTAFVAVPYAAAIVLWSRARRPARSLALLASGAAVLMAPWLVKNWLIVRNPLAPLLNAVFINPYIHAGFDREYGAYLRLYELPGRAQIPWAVTISGEGAVAGVLGPVFLLAPIGLAALWHAQGRQLWIAALAFGLPYPLNIGTRFLIPLLPFVALALSLALGRIRGAAPAAVALHALLSWPSVVARYTDPYTWRIPEIPWKAALRRESEEGYLLRRLPGYGAARLIERHVPPGERVFAFNSVGDAYTSREIVARYQSALGKTLGSILWTPVITDFAPTWQLGFHWPAQALRRIRVFQTATHPTDYWSVAELRVFRAGAEVPRRPEWRLRAWPNPFEAGYAFDNSPLTRWSTWEPLYPGMYLEVDFGREEVVDAVLLEAAHDQYGIRLKLDGRLPDGSWQALSDGDLPRDMEPPPAMRRNAAREVKALSIRHLLIADSDYEAADYRERAAEWGLRLLGEHRGIRLYRIE